MEEDSKINPPQSSIKVYRRLLCYLKPYRSRFALAMLAMVVYGSTDGLVPIILKKILDDIFGARDENILWFLVIGIVIFAIVRAVFGFFQKYLTASIGLDIVKDLRNDISAKLLSLSASFFQRNSSGALLSRMTNDTLLVRQALTDAVAAMLRDTVRVIALLAAAFYLDPILALVAFIGFPICLIPIIKFGKRVRRHSRDGQHRLGDLTSILHEMTIGHRVVQAFSMEKFEKDRFKAENSRLTDAIRRAEKYSALSSPTNELIASVAIALIIVYGGLSVMSGVRTQGDFIAFITAVFLLYEPLKKLGRLNAIIQTGVAAADRVFDVLDEQPDIVESPDAVVLEDQAAQVSYKNVFFRYAELPTSENQDSEISCTGTSRTGEWALSGINLDVPVGSTVALVGMSGGGKSTLVNLLPRFFDPQSGSIEVNGIDIKNLTLESLRRSIAVVGQNTFLFNDTVFNNIAYGKVGATEAEVVEAAKAAHADQFINSFPDGYNTIVGEHGLRLSGGERARLAIARALLRNSPILILDEATAALDSESEKLVQSAIEKLMQGRTVLVIAHRLATVRKANAIAVISDGRIVEQGTHEELIKNQGAYAKLHRIQFAEGPNEAVENQALVVGRGGV